VLGAYGVAVVDERTAETAEEAVAAAEALGFPVAVKSALAGAHKTELGAVALDLRDPAAVRAAAERIGPPLLVQRFVPTGVELLVGAMQDPVFGPLVALGPGGVLAELIGEAVFRLAPLTDVDAEELVGSRKVGRLLEGFRGAPAADSAAVAETVIRIGTLAANFPELAELDLNPVIAQQNGCVTVDARIRVAAPPPRPSLKSW
jgi:acyl-CoA synthetase (NDP forming)